MSEELLYVQIGLPKPNPLFTEEQRQAVRFLSYNKHIPCAECGNKKRVQWTMICEFLAHSMGHLVPSKSGLVHPPLTPVCQDHLITPAWPEAKGEAPEPPGLPEEPTEGVT
jgi:hypothetical protein